MSKKKEPNTYNLGNPNEFQELLKKTSKENEESPNIGKTKLSLKELREKGDKGEIKVKKKKPIEATPPLID
ncbi:MAG: hypothetical protein ACPGU6_07700, partial [Tenacibaculum sp.]